LTTILFHQGFVLAGSSHYEDASSQGGAVRLVDVQRGISGDSLLGESMSAGPLAMADVDGDGALEIFIGGRVVAGQYPRPATSLLVKNEGGRLRVVQRFPDLGLVHGAVFGDLTGDGKPELVLACEWDSIRVFKSQQGELKEITKSLGLDPYNGWWMSVGLGDFDGDGRLDIVAGNWGRNDFFAGNPDCLPIRCRYGEFDETGYFHIIQSYQGVNGQEWPMNKFGSIAKAWPVARDLIPNHGTYGERTLVGIYGEGLARLPVLEMSWPESTVFLNRSGSFEVRPLPMKAQVSPVTTLAVSDWDGDGRMDVWLGQNVLPVHAEAARQDAGRGVLLKGDGQGGFDPVPAWTSGIAVYGEARGAAVGDWDRDGRPDLVVGQNGADTKFFHNKMARPGLRLELQGPNSNPTAVGTQIRWMRDGQPVGPVQEVLAGSGSLGVDSPRLVLARQPHATHLQIRWPHGTRQIVEVPPDAIELKVTRDGVSR
jgi:hypothetical protein